MCLRQQTSDRSESICGKQHPLHHRCLPSCGELHMVFQQHQGLHDFGNRYCWAANAKGQMTDPCVIQIIPAGKSLDLKSYLSEKSKI